MALRRTRPVPHCRSALWSLAGRHEYVVLTDGYFGGCRCAGCTAKGKRLAAGFHVYRVFRKNTELSFFFFFLMTKTKITLRRTFTLNLQNVSLSES